MWMLVVLMNQKEKQESPIFLEHLAFKGTKEIGTINYEKEKQILEELDKTFQQIKEAKKRE